jgi:hypothetical protein
MCLHYMAIGATFWIVAQIARALTVAECKQSNAAKDAQHHGEQRSEECSTLKQSPGKRIVPFVTGVGYCGFVLHCLLLGVGTHVVSRL